MIFRRSSLVEAAKRYLDEYIAYDPFELGFYLRRRLFDYMAGRGPKKLIRDLGDLTEIGRLFAFNSMISMVSLLANILLDSGYLETIDKKRYSRFMTSLLEIIERGDIENLDMQARSLTIDLLPDSELFSPTSGKMLERIITNARSKISYVRVTIGEPLKHGLTFSERLLKLGINSIAVKDDMRYWAIERSHAVIIPSYAMTSDGLIVTDYGVEPAVKLAWKLGKKVYVVHPWSGLLGPYTSSEVEASAIGLKVRPFDIIDPEGGETLLVTDKFVVRLDKEIALKSIDQASRALNEIVRIAFSNVMEGR